MTQIRITPGPDTERPYRDALGCFATGIAVVTTSVQGRPVGITINSFSSVSLDPPLVLWCPGRGSVRHDQFVNAQHFAIHILSESQQTLAAHFARDGENFASASWEPDTNGTPILQDALARFDCAHHAVHDGGDHSILLGRVLSASYTEGTGLIYNRGQYGSFKALD